MSSPDEKIQKIARLSSHFRQIRFFAIMLTCLIGGTSFGVLRLLPLVRGEPTDWAGLTIAWIFSVIGFVMLSFLWRKRRQASSSSLRPSPKI